MDYVRRRDRIIIKLPKVTDFYLATLIREEDGVFYVKLDRGDYFSFKNKDLIVERGIDRICPELITADRIYDYIRGIGDTSTHVNKPETEALIPKVEEVITPEAEIRKEAFVDKKEEVEEDKSEDADSLEEDVPEDLEAYDETEDTEGDTPEEIPDSSKEVEPTDESVEETEDSEEDMFDVPEEKIDESVTVEEKKPEEGEPVEEVSDSSKEVEETPDEVDDSVVVEETEKPEEEEKPSEAPEEIDEPIDDSVEIEESEEEPEEETESTEESDDDSEETESEKATIKSNLDDPDIMVEDSANQDAGDIDETMIGNVPYYLRSLILLEAARSFSKNDRLIIRVRAENKYYLATVTMNRKGMLHIVFDHGEKHSLKPSSSLIMGIGQVKKYPYAITLNQLHRFLLVPFSTKVVKDRVPRKVLSPKEVHEKAKKYISEDEPKKENIGPYPTKTPKVKSFKTSYKKKSNIKIPKSDKPETGYLSKMTPKEIDDMIS